MESVPGVSKHYIYIERGPTLLGDACAHVLEARGYDVTSDARQLLLAPLVVLVVDGRGPIDAAVARIARLRAMGLSAPLLIVGPPLDAKCADHIVEAGADAYVPIDATAADLPRQCRAWLRHSSGHWLKPPSTTSVTVNPQTCEVQLGQRRAVLSPTQLRLFAYPPVAFLDRSIRRQSA